MVLDLEKYVFENPSLSQRLSYLSGKYHKVTLITTQKVLFDSL